MGSIKKEIFMNGEIIEVKSSSGMVEITISDSKHFCRSQYTVCLNPHVDGLFLHFSGINGKSLEVKQMGSNQMVIGFTENER
jgi:hypothetical protein